MCTARERGRGRRRRPPLVAQPVPRLEGLLDRGDPGGPLRVPGAGVVVHAGRVGEVDRPHEGSVAHSTGGTACSDGQGTGWVATAPQPVPWPSLHAAPPADWATGAGERAALLLPPLEPRARHRRRHPERIARIAAIEAGAGPARVAGMGAAPAPAAPAGRAGRGAHLRHLTQVRAIGRGRGGALDPTRPCRGGSWDAALHAAGGAFAMAEALMAGGGAHAASRGAAAGAPRRPRPGMGFCLFNNVAVAARHAIDELGAERVLIVDWDVHHGNGTKDIFRTDATRAVRQHPPVAAFPGTGRCRRGSGAGGASRSTCRCRPGSGDDTWRRCSSGSSIPAGAEFGPDLILISAGFDAHRDDPLGGCALDAACSARWRATCARWASGWAPRSAPCWRAATTWPPWPASVAETMEAARRRRRAGLGRPRLRHLARRLPHRSLLEALTAGGRRQPPARRAGGRRGVSAPGPRDGGARPPTVRG